MTHRVPDRTDTTERLPAPPRMTYEEFLDWLDEDTHAEWVNGEVVMHSPVSLRHQKVRGFIFRLMAEWVETYDLGEIADDPFQMKTGPELPGRAPDILFVAREHLSRLKPNHLDGPADLVVEIISPDSRGRDRGDKHDEYESGGVREYWLIDPDRRRAEFYAPGADGYYSLLAVDAEGMFHSQVLPGFWLRVAWLWQDPLPWLRSIRREWGMLPSD